MATFSDCGLSDIKHTAAYSQLSARLFRDFWRQKCLSQGSGAKLPLDLCRHDFS
jgi:hypothetical protein